MFGLTLAVLLNLEARAVAAATLVVDTVSDVVDGDTLSIWALLSDPGPDGFISLREAIVVANNTANGGSPDEIHFNIAGPGPHTIVVSLGGLPALGDTEIGRAHV